MLHSMADSENALSGAIGARVRQERKVRGWTLDRLAEISGVSRRMVVSIEQGSANPSIGTLLRISDALGVGLPALVEPPDPAAGKVTRRGEGSELWHGEHGGTGILLVGTQAPDVVELWDWTFGVGDEHRSEAHAPGTRELLQMHDGTVEVIVGDDRFTVSAGDALLFAGDLPHAYRNAGESVARLTLAVFEPNVGSQTNGGAHAR